MEDPPSAIATPAVATSEPLENKQPASEAPPVTSSSIKNSTEAGNSDGNVVP